MNTLKTSQIALRVNSVEREKFLLLSTLENMTVSELVISLVDRELESKVLNHLDLRKLPKEIRIKLLKQMTKSSLPIYEKHKVELSIDEIGDGIE
jgi:hypothetical protein